MNTGPRKAVVQVKQTDFLFELKFDYDIKLVNIVRSLRWAYRSYDMDRGVWMVWSEVGWQLIAAIESAGYEVLIELAQATPEAA